GVGKVRRPGVLEGGAQVDALAADGAVDVQDQQRRGDREDAVGERLQPGRAHVSAARRRSPRSPSGSGSPVPPSASRSTFLAGAGSRWALRAEPCVVTQREMWTPIDAIFLGGGVSQTPVRPSILLPASANADSVCTSDSSRSRQYLRTSRPWRFRSKIG